MMAKKYTLFDHDGVLVDTEFWYYKATERALAEVGLILDKDQYLRDMTQGLGTWVQARAAGMDFSQASHRIETLTELKDIVLDSLTLTQRQAG